MVLVKELRMILSKRVAKGEQNPISHKDYQKLKNKDLFIEKDCMEKMSLLLHLC